MSVGKVWNSLASAAVENSFSLVQVNLDFTLQKVIAPHEYRPVGQALSSTRRSNAEHGPAHRTARKLGCLFAQLIPNTPKLLKAYGRRVCDTLSIPGFNPGGSEADGPFRDYVGIDCTSLWAAATSGIPSLGVHLLACLLARAWDAQTATAIWVELVEFRRNEILSEGRQTNNMSVETVAAARQDFLRSELEGWDSSARAWLSQADKALTSLRDQYLLIVKNVSLPTGCSTSPHRNVIGAWTSAMRILENHLEGISQQVSDGSVMYAMSSWHLYPDLVYFGKEVKKVEFHDTLFEKDATITLGLTGAATSQDNQGPHWSLALSHLRFYGEPVPVETVEDRTRATVSQFQVILLGAVLESWQVALCDRSDAIRWIWDLWEYLEKTSPTEIKNIYSSQFTSWLVGLAEAAKYILSAEGFQREQCEDYLSHGERWGGVFLLGTDPHCFRTQPFFGLCCPLVMAALEESLDIEAGIQYLRRLSISMGLNDHEALIQYSHGEKSYYEYATAVPHADDRSTNRHARWIKAEIADGEENIDIDFRTRMITDRGEYCFQLEPRALKERKLAFPGIAEKSDCLLWEDPASVYSCMISLICCFVT